jgi:hypothetical protein
VKTEEEIRRKIAKLELKYDRVKDSGTVSEAFTRAAILTLLWVMDEGCEP